MHALDLRSHDGLLLRAWRGERGLGAPPVLVVPPLATRPSFVAPALEALGGGFDVLTWEARLVLDPQARFDDPQALSLEAHARDVEALLDQAEAPPAALLGYCSGAALALHLAARLPGRFTRLALVSGAYFLRPEQCELTQYERDVLALAPQIAQSRERAAGLHAAFFAEGRAFRRRGHEFAGEVYRPYADAESLYRFGLTLCALIAGDSAARAGAIDLPALVAWGGCDDQTHPDSSRLMCATLRACEGHCDAALDHYALCRAHPGLLARLTRFLAQA